MTDDKSLKKELRRQLQIETAGKKLPSARLTKIAGKTPILRSILASPPSDRSAQRKSEYFEWAAEVVAQCRGINVQLDHLVIRMLRRRAPRSSS